MVSPRPEEQSPKLTCTNARWDDRSIQKLLYLLLTDQNLIIQLVLSWFCMMGPANFLQQRHTQTLRFLFYRARKRILYSTHKSIEHTQICTLLYFFPLRTLCYYIFYFVVFSRGWLRLSLQEWRLIRNRRRQVCIWVCFNVILTYHFVFEIKATSDNLNEEIKQKSAVENHRGHRQQRSWCGRTRGKRRPEKWEKMSWCKGHRNCANEFWSQHSSFDLLGWEHCRNVVASLEKMNSTCFYVILKIRYSLVIEPL